MKIVISIIVIVLLIGGGLAISKFLEATAPEAAKKERVDTMPAVEVFVAKKADIEIPLTSEGIVRTRRETVLSAQVAGKVVKVDPRFEVGETFSEGEVIAEIDQIDYETAVVQAKATVQDARLAVQQEKARGAQALRDWKKIGQGRTPSDLVLRKPYLASAEARLAAARSALDRVIEDLARTVIRAPFDCRVRRVDLNLGATVAPGTPLGVIYDAENLMVQLPLSLDDFARASMDSEVTLKAEIGGEIYRWMGKVVRDVGEIDEATLSAGLVVTIAKNEEIAGRFQLPPPGLFVEAEISGEVLAGVVAVPREAVRGRDQVAVLTEEGKLAFRSLKIAQGDAEFVYVSDGVENGERIVLTRLEVPVEGMSLQVADSSRAGE